MSVPSPAEFRNAIAVDTDNGPRRFGEVIDAWQRQDFEALDASWQLLARGEGGGGPMRAWIERPRGHSKTMDQAVAILWALLTSTRRLKGIAAAADQEQAGLLRSAIAGLVATHPFLRDKVTVSKNRIVSFRMRHGVKEEFSELQVISADAASSYGLTPDFICCDEVSHWRNSDLWESLFSAAAKRKNCLLIVITNAGFRDSWQWQVREAARTSPGWYFNSLDGPKASWISVDRLDEQRRLLPAIAFARLWLNQWGEGSGDAFSDAEIDRSLASGLGPMLGGEKGWHFYAGLDLGLSRDASAMAVVGQHVGHSEYIQPEKPSRAPSVFDIMADLGLSDDAPPIDEPEWELASVEPPTGRLRLADVQAWRASKLVKVDLEEVERAVLAAHRRFNFQAVNYDPWQCELLAARLVRQGVPMIPTPFVASSLAGMASATLSAFNDSRIDLYGCPELIADLRRLRVVERPNGCRLESPRDASGHGDRATAFSLALLGTRRHTNTSQTIEGPLLIG